MSFKKWFKKASREDRDLDAFNDSPVFLDFLRQAYEAGRREVRRKAREAMYESGRAGLGIGSE